MASTYLTRNNGSAVTAERRTFTISVWLKRSAIGTEHAVCTAGNGGGSEEFALRIRNDDTIEVWHYDGSSFVGRKRTNRVLRDMNAWYHIFCQYDTTESTADDRIKFYINGVRETSFADSVNPTSNDNTPWNVDERHQIGSSSWGNSGNGTNHFDGCMSHFYNVAGSIIDISQFGETDSTTGEWKIKTNPTIASYGTAGFLVLKDGITVTDQSPNSNNFTVGGTLTKTEDCPSNNFCTMGTYARFNGTVSNGGNTLTTTQSNYRYQAGTIGVDRGKWYWEVKLSTLANYALMGITDTISTPTTSNYILGSGSYDYSVYYGDGSTGGGNGHMYNGAGAGPNNTPGQFMAGFSQGDIVTFALDLDSATKKLYVGANGQWANGSNATNQTFSNSTGKSIVVPQNTNSGFYFPAGGDYSGNSDSTLQFNFGNGYFGTTAVATAGTNASNNGIFEYDVPSGYTALCTKGLNS
tara:strand:+ start:396 stop:1796 length:1401 start_codon:yes stop_codon:yes gene_type:complete